MGARFLSCLVTDRSRCVFGGESSPTWDQEEPSVLRRDLLGQIGINPQSDPSVGQNRWITKTPVARVIVATGASQEARSETSLSLPHSWPLFGTRILHHPCWIEVGRRKTNKEEACRQMGKLLGRSSGAGAAGQTVLPDGSERRYMCSNTELTRLLIASLPPRAALVSYRTVLGGFTPGFERKRSPFLALFFIVFCVLLFLCPQASVGSTVYL